MIKHLLYIQYTKLGFTSTLNDLDAKLRLHFKLNLFLPGDVWFLSYWNQYLIKLGKFYIFHHRQLKAWVRQEKVPYINIYIFVYLYMYLSITLLTWRVIHIVYWIMHDVLFFCDNIIVIGIYITFYLKNTIDNILKG